ncbi:unnamed protein product [Oppiella nova]|uniref:SH3 domain-containing protein n=1 Tax=Oppiella nova TaxID=334625 RepID=A0A7R9LKA3_9ACAR|nr:unnamed protein product [Oppiella nova]CAG2163818.1 unnamed protein product [Oppiella nova]
MLLSIFNRSERYVLDNLWLLLVYVVLSALSQALYDYHNNCANVLRSLTTRLKGRTEPKSAVDVVTDVWATTVNRSTEAVVQYNGAMGLMKLNGHINHKVNTKDIFAKSQSIATKSGNQLRNISQNISQQPLRQEKPKCRALYDFESKSSDELSLKEGDVIELKKRMDNHWFEGILNGRIEAGAAPDPGAAALVFEPVAEPAAEAVLEPAADGADGTAVAEPALDADTADPAFDPVCDPGAALVLEPTADGSALRTVLETDDDRAEGAALVLEPTTDEPLALTAEPAADPCAEPTADPKFVPLPVFEPVLDPTADPAAGAPVLDPAAGGAPVCEPPPSAGGASAGGCSPAGGASAGAPSSGLGPPPPQQFPICLNKADLKH